jgi:hypothetical protein
MSHRIAYPNPSSDLRRTDSDGTTQGHQAMTVKAQTLLERLPGFVFTAASPVHVSSDLGFLAFNMGVRRVADSQLGST